MRPLVFVTGRPPSNKLSKETDYPVEFVRFVYRSVDRNGFGSPTWK
jgi:hypothetical protein